MAFVAGMNKERTDFVPAQGQRSMANDALYRTVSVQAGSGPGRASNSSAEEGGGWQTTGRETPDVETSSEGYAARFRGGAGAYLLAVQRRGIETILGDSRIQGAKVLDV